MRLRRGCGRHQEADGESERKSADRAHGVHEGSQAGRLLVTGHHEPDEQVLGAQQDRHAEREKDGEVGGHAEQGNGLSSGPSHESTDHDLTQRDQHDETCDAPQEAIDDRGGRVLGTLAHGSDGAIIERSLARTVAVFQFLPRKLQGSVRERTGEGVRQAAMVSARALVDAQLRCRRWGALDDRRPIDLTSNPEAYTSVRVTWLDDRSRARLNGLLRQVSTVLREGCIARKGRRTCVLIYHFPDYTASEARMLRANSPTPRSPKRQSL